MSHLKVLDQITLTIHRLGLNGEGIGDFEGHTIYVDGVLPGEIAKVSLLECHTTYAKASLLELIHSSNQRKIPICQFFEQCGGCQLMHLDDRLQQMFKQQKVIHALQKERLLTGITPQVCVEACISSPEPLQYRHKILLPVVFRDNQLQIGLYAKSSHNLIEIDKCHIHSALGEKIHQDLKTIIKQSGITAFDGEEGILRHILIRTSLSFNEAQVTLVVSRECREFLIPIAEQIINSSPCVKGVICNVNQKAGNVILGKADHILLGNGYIRERIGDLLFNISSSSFFQINPKQAEYLYLKALELANVTSQDVILDAYCGVGTISLFFAKYVKKVIGIECISAAIEDAKENARINHINNVEFVCAHAEDFIKSLYSVDLVVLNPPRKGCENKFLEGILRLSPKKIVYISCEPRTLARDLAYLCSHGYQIVIVQPFDMFPQTAHVECVVSLVLTSF